MAKRGTDPQPIDVTKPSDLPPIGLKPIEPKPVDVVKPDAPDVSTGWLEESLAALRLLVRSIASGDVTVRQVVELPGQIKIAAIAIGVLLLLVILSQIARC